MEYPPIAWLICSQASSTACQTTMMVAERKICLRSRPRTKRHPASQNRTKARIAERTDKYPVEIW